MVDVNAKVINRINGLLAKTDLPTFTLTKRKSWAYEKDGARVYMFTDPEVEGVMLVAIFKENGAVLEYSVVDGKSYSKTSYNFYKGEIVKKQYFDTGKGYNK